VVNSRLWGIEAATALLEDGDVCIVDDDVDLAPRAAPKYLLMRAVSSVLIASSTAATLEMAIAAVSNLL